MKKKLQQLKENVEEMIGRVGDLDAQLTGLRISTQHVEALEVHLREASAKIDDMLSFCNEDADAV